MAGLTVRLLGVPEVEVDSRPLRVDTRKAIALLAYLVVRQEPASRDELATLLWPDFDQENARASLRRTLSALRSALGDRWLVAQRDAVQLKTDGVWSDVWQFGALLAESRGHAHQPATACTRCRDLLTQAAALYRGDFMSGFSLRDSLEFEDWQFAQAQAWQRDFDGALAALVIQHEAAGDIEAALTWARRRLELDRLSEEAHVAVMRLLALSGDRSAALLQYRELVRILDQELGVSPLEGTAELHSAIAEGSLVRRAPVVSELSASAAPVRAGDLPMVGRSRQMHELLALLEERSRQGRLVVLEGEAGIGKTRLLMEFIAAARSMDVPVVSTRCFEGETSLAYEAIVDLLRSALALPGADERLRRVLPLSVAEAARLLPELTHRVPDLPAPPGTDSPGAQTWFFKGLLDVLTACICGGPLGVLAVDDVSLADDASLDVLSFLAHRLHDYPLVLVLAWRPEDVPAGHRLRVMASNAQQSAGVTTIELHRLSAEDVDGLVGLLGNDGTDARRLFKETEGLPLFLAQYLSAGSRLDEESWPIPVGIRELLLSRVARLAELPKQLLTSAAVLGRSFSFDLLHIVSGRSEDEAIAGLEALLSERLVVELEAPALEGGPVYDFCHEKLRTLVYEETSLARRRLLHRRAADALVPAMRTRRDGSALCGLVAHHLRLSGNDIAAAGYFKLAGDHARSLHANAEAESHYKNALALGYDEPDSLHEAIADLRTLAGDYRSALAGYEKAAALAQDDRLPEIEHKQGRLFLRSGQWERAEHYLERALQGSADTEDTARQARIITDLSLAAYRKGDARRARELAERALSFSERGQEGAALVQAHNVLGVLLRGSGALQEAERHLRTALALSGERDDGGRMAVCNNLALVYEAKGDYATALSFAQEALRLCEMLGDRHREAAIRNNLADLHHRSGASEEAMAQLKQAVGIFTEVGLSIEEVQPEIWKLYEW
jgi:DNA-binding SARP family transcriptional activator/Tfp pilus assembly protein PilF